jgi:hypothetical protein
LTKIIIKIPINDNQKPDLLRIKIKKLPVRINNVPIKSKIDSKG